MLTAEFFANPRCPPGTSSVAPTLDPVAVSREDCSENSPAAVGVGTILPTDPPVEPEVADELDLIL